MSYVFVYMTQVLSEPDELKWSKYIYIQIISDTVNVLGTISVISKMSFTMIPIFIYYKSGSIDYWVRITIYHVISDCSIFQVLKTVI